MLHKMFNALADVWRGFIYSTAEYQTTVATVIFSANGVRQIFQNHLNYAVFMRHNMCYFVALFLCHWPILASGFIQVISTVVYTAVFSAVDRVVDADEQYSVSFFRNHLFHFISSSRHIFQPRGLVLAVVNIKWAVLHKVKTIQRRVSKPVTVIPRGFMPK